MNLEDLQRVVATGVRRQYNPMGDAYSNCYSHPFHPGRCFLYRRGMGFYPSLAFNEAEYKLIGGIWSMDGDHFVTFSGVPDQERFFHFHVYRPGDKKLVGQEMIWLASRKRLTWQMTGQYLILMAVDQIRIYRLVSEEEDPTLRLRQLHQITIFADIYVERIGITSDGYYFYTQTALLDGEVSPNVIDEIVVGRVTEEAEHWVDDSRRFRPQTRLIRIEGIISQLGSQSMLVAIWSGNTHLYLALRVVQITLLPPDEVGRTLPILQSIIIRKEMQRISLRDAFETGRGLMDPAWVLPLKEYRLGEELFRIHPEERFAMHIFPNKHHPDGKMEYHYQIIMVDDGRCAYEVQGSVLPNQDYQPPVLDRSGNCHMFDYGEAGLQKQTFYHPTLRARAEDYMVQILIQKITGCQITIL